MSNSKNLNTDERVVKFLDEFECYANALSKARDQGSCGEDLPIQQQMCRA